MEGGNLKREALVQSVCGRTATDEAGEDENEERGAWGNAFVNCKVTVISRDKDGTRDQLLSF